MAGDLETSCVLMKPDRLSPVAPLDYQSQSTIRVNADLLIVLALVLVLVLDLLVFATHGVQVIGNQSVSNQCRFLIGLLITDHY